MVDSLMLYYQQFMQISKENPVVASVIGLWGAGVITYLLRNVPGAIANFFKTQTTTVLYMNNAGWTGNGYNFQSFLKWYLTHKWAKYSRTLSLESQWSRDGRIDIIGAGYGTHFFFYKGRLFWFTKKRMDNSATDTVKEEITINTLSRNQELIKALIDEFKHRDPNKKNISAYRMEKDTWSDPIYLQERPIETVVIPGDIKEDLIEQIKAFRNNRDWYIQRGLPYKLVICLHGPTGTGKTSLVRALATYFKTDVYTLAVSQLSDQSFVKALTTVNENSFVLLEDFDTAFSLHRRSNVLSYEEQRLSEEKKRELAKKDNEGEFSFLTLSGFLNALDGIIPLNGTILFMSTNKLEVIDPAVLRKGRVDKSYLIGYMKHEDVCRYIEVMFPEYILDQRITFDEIPGCEVYARFQANPNDPDKFVESLPWKYPSLTTPKMSAVI